MIYFIRSPAGPIKIGTTIRLSQRLRWLATEYGPGLEVLAVVDGSFDVERALHGRFAHLRQVGEWFEPGDDLMGFIVSDGRPWDGSDEVPARHGEGTAVRLDSGLVSKARYICAEKNISMTEYISEMIRARVEKDFAKAKPAPNPAEEE